MLIEQMKDIDSDLVISQKLIGERGQDEPRIRLSSLGNDLQKQYLDISGDGEKEEIDDRKKRIFDAGHIFEAYIFARLEGIIHDKDKIVNTGIFDNENKEIRGEIDCLYTDDYGITFVVDVKTMSDNSFRKLMEYQDIKKSHYVYYVQLQMYMHFLGIEDGFILAYNKNNSEMGEVFCVYDRDFCLEHIKRIGFLLNALKKDNKPELEYENITYYKTQKVRNKEEYRGLGQIISEPHPMNRYNHYIDTERVVIDDIESKGRIFTERCPQVDG